MSKMGTDRDWIAGLFAFFVAACTALLYFYRPEILSRLCREDGVVQNGTALFYFLAACAFLWANKRDSFKNVWFWLYSLLFFAVAGEEISWGQRIFGMNTPEILMEMNIQKEINLHNISGIHGIARMAGVLVVLGICYLVPLAHRFIPALRSKIEALRMPVFPLELWLVPSLAVALMAAPRLLFHQIIFDLDEMGEMLLSVAFLFFSLRVLSRRR